LEAGSVLPSLNFSQLDFVKPSSGFHPVTWERINNDRSSAKLDASYHPPALLMDENLDRVLCNDHCSAKLDASYHPPTLLMDENLDRILCNDHSSAKNLMFLTIHQH